MRLLWQRNSCAYPIYYSEQQLISASYPHQVHLLSTFFSLSMPCNSVRTACIQRVNSPEQACEQLASSQFHYRQEVYPKENGKSTSCEFAVKQVYLNAAALQQLND